MNEIIKEEKDFENNKISHPDKTFRKTFSGGFKNRKNILKSNSDIFVINHKYPVLKEILLNDEEPFNIYRIKKMEKALSNENIFDRNIKSSIGRIINKNPKNCKYDLIDEFNKELIKGNFMYKNSKKLFLPKLPPRHKLFNLLNNLSFNKTTNNFYRTRKKRKWRPFLFGPFTSEQDIGDDLPKILPVSTERVFQISLQITTLALLDFLQGLGHIDIKRRQKAWLCFNSKFL